MMEKVIITFLLTVAGKLIAVPTHQADTQLGNSVTLPCQDNYNTDTPVDLLDVQWWTEERLVTRFHHDKLIQGSRYINRIDLSAEGLKKGDFSLYINHTEYSDSGRYRCVLNKDGQNITLGQVDLEVKVPIFPSDLFAESRQRVILSCFGRVDWSGSEAAFVQWKRGAQVVVQWRSGSLYVDPEFEGRVSVPKERIIHGDLSLIFNITHPDDQGYYLCFFKKNNDIRPSAIVTLIVTEHLSRVNVSSGSQYHLPLPSESAVTLSFLPDVGNYTVSVCEVERCRDLTCTRGYTNRTLLNNNSLILRNITSADSGTFILKNKDTGRTKKVVIIQVFGAGTEKVIFSPLEILIVVFGMVPLVLLSACCIYMRFKKRKVKEQEASKMSQLEQKETEKHPLEQNKPEIQTLEVKTSEMQPLRLTEVISQD